MNTDTKVYYVQNGEVGCHMLGTVATLRKDFELTEWEAWEGEATKQRELARSLREQADLADEAAKRAAHNSDVALVALSGTRGDR